MEIDLKLWYTTRLNLMLASFSFWRKHLVSIFTLVGVIILKKFKFVSQIGIGYLAYWWLLVHRHLWKFKCTCVHTLKKIIELILFMTIKSNRWLFKYGVTWSLIIKCVLLPFKVLTYHHKYMDMKKWGANISFRHSLHGEIELPFVAWIFIVCNLL